MLSQFSNIRGVSRISGHFQTSKQHNFLKTLFTIRALACICFTPFFTAVHNQERVIIQAIHVLNKEILQ